jgi:Protein of unknown function (DUF416)
MEIKYNCFDELNILFKDIPQLHQVAFCASLSERILPNFNLYDRGCDGDNFSYLKNILNEIWQSLSVHKLNSNRIAKLINDFASKFEEHGEDLAAFPESENSLMCLDITLTLCLEQNEGLVASAIKQVHDSFYYYFQNIVFIALDNDLNEQEIEQELSIINIEDILPFQAIRTKYKNSYKERNQGIDKQLNTLIANHPLLLKEIKKENEDLRRLRESSILTPKLLRWLRTSSENGGKSFLDIC